jgi:hypothetical protein
MKNGKSWKSWRRENEKMPPTPFVKRLVSKMGVSSDDIDEFSLPKWKKKKRPSHLFHFISHNRSESLRNVKIFR